MLEAVREYAVARLAASRDPDAIRDRHLGVYLARAESVRHLQDTDMDAWRAVVSADYENYGAAITWGLSRDDPGPARRLATELAWFWHNSRRGREGVDLLRKAIDLGAGERTALQARLLTGLALVADTTAPLSMDCDAAGLGLDIAAEVGDRRTACLAMLLRGVSSLYSDFQAAWDLAEQSGALAREAGYGFVRDSACVLKGMVCNLRDDHEQAMALLRTGVDGLIGRNDRGVAATALGCLAISAAYTGDLPTARTLAQEGVRVATPLGDYHRVGSAHTVLAHVETLAGRTDEAWTAMEPEPGESPPGQ